MSIDNKRRKLLVIYAVRKVQTYAYAYSIYRPTYMQQKRLAAGTRWGSSVFVESHMRLSTEPHATKPHGVTLQQVWGGGQVEMPNAEGIW